jgi:ABC-type lipoprotein release transport system permease subunit
MPLSAFLVDGLNPHNPTAFFGTALLLFVISVIATLSPARRALKVNPVKALRAE